MSTLLLPIQPATSNLTEEFEISMVRELTFFLSLQIKQMKDGLFLSQSKYEKHIVKGFWYTDDTNLNCNLLLC